MSTATATVTGDWQVRLVTDDPGPGMWRRVAFTGLDVVIGSSPEAFDRWAPLNVPLVYTWTGVDLLETLPVTVVSDRPVLSSTLYAGSMQVTVVSQAPLTVQGRSVVHQVIGRPDPVVSVAPAGYPAGTLRLWMPDRATRLELHTMLRSGDPLILRATCPDAVDDLTLQPLSWSDPLVSEESKAGGRWLDVDFEAVSQTPGDWLAPPPWTWADAEAGFASWDAFEAAFASWADAEQGPVP